jgi:FkbH-like protein
MLVPELPEDPSEYVPFLASLNPFETATYTSQDAQRTIEYQNEALRHAEREKFVDLGDFLRSLEMRMVVRPFLPFNFPRIAQLTQRSNQFNLRTVRYTVQHIASLADSSAHVTLTFEMNDRFGDNGLISVVILEIRGETFFVDTWLNTVVQAARERGIKRIEGEYLPTPKNGMVRDHYAKQGFSPDGGRWILETAGYEDRAVQIALCNDRDVAHT